MPDRGRTLEDFPIHGAPYGAPAPAEPAAALSFDAAPGSPEPSAAAAPLSARLAAAAADAATILLLTALAVLAARLATGESPRPAGLAWIAVFVVYLSAFAIVLPLVVFGRTVGMALADLSARPGAAAAGLSPDAAFRRWVGTLAAAGTLGLLLLWTGRDAAAPTPADRLSGCALTGD